MVVKLSLLENAGRLGKSPLHRVEKSGVGFRKLNHDVVMVPWNSIVICRRLNVFLIKED